jgi:hypothetical protein
VTPLAGAALLVLIGSLSASILSWAFCARPAPRQLRIAREIALALVAARVVAVESFDVEVGVPRFLFWGLLGLLTLAITGWNLRSVMGTRRDRCTP